MRSLSRFCAGDLDRHSNLVAKLPGVLELEVKAVEKAIAESSQEIEKRRKLWRGCHYRNPVLAASREHLKLDDKKLKAATLLAMRGDAQDLEMLSASPACAGRRRMFAPGKREMSHSRRG
ncbi:MAG: hypothetical protein DLM68_09805 [Hyphomicrobiales bacterium]|nr:MAG: hypothetical protein DLM68_09805 [Hyphomicrobiales bacterium]